MKKDFPFSLLFISVVYVILFVLVLIYGDPQLALFFNPSSGSIHDNYIALILKIFTESIFYIGGLFLFLTLISLIFSKWKSFRPSLLSISLSLTLTHLVINLIKPAINRLRPYQVLGSKINTFGVFPPLDSSMPSGHSGSSMDLAASLDLNAKKKWIGIILFFLAFLIGFTRLYFGFHFLSDVIVGGIIGIILAYLSQYLIAKLYEKKVMTYVMEWITFVVIVLGWIGVYFLT